MGHGEYSTNRATLHSTTQNYANKSTEEVFKRRSIDNAMSPHAIDVRESRDSEDHPESLAIFLGLDVTASMGNIPHKLITDGLTHIMGTIIEHGIEHPQLLFAGIGDHKVDSAPLQVSQFESSDPLLDKWLKELYLEGGGGGNGGESYALAWYFAGYHTSIDCFEKRNQKGFLFTVGDEPIHNRIPKAAMDNIMKNNQLEADATAVQLLEHARQMYHVKHFHIYETSTGRRQETKDSLKEIMGDDVIFVENYTNLPNMIAQSILDTYQGGGSNADKTEQQSESKEEVIL